MRLMDRSWLVVLPLSVLAFACSSQSDSAVDPSDSQGEQEAESEVVPEGKADNYLSPTSMEYDLSGQGTFSLDSAWAKKTAAEKEAQAKSLLGFRFKAYSHFINQYVVNKEAEQANASYGGFTGLVRSSSVDQLVEAASTDKMSWSFMWSIEMGGPRDLLSKLPTKTRPNGERYFTIQIPVLTDSQLMSSSYPKDFDPAKYTGKLESLEVSIRGIKESADAYPDYKSMFSDGKLDMLIVVGGDYNAERYDLKAAESIFTWLKTAGYSHPAKAFTELRPESPPFTKSFTANGKPVSIEISLVHPDMVADSDLNKTKDRIVAGFRNADVVIYDGHAGEDPSYSGVVYHYNPRAAISANELAKLGLPSKYQLFLFNGCHTYGAYADALAKAPGKTTKNLDIITTVNFSWLTMQPFTTSSFINRLTAKKSGGHDPQTFLEILQDINRSNNANVYYGVHGIDDNGHLNPYADTSALCRSCSTDSSCPGIGNQCIKLSSTAKACGAECTADDACPSGYRCAQIAAGGKITGRQCLPKTNICK